MSETGKPSEQSMEEILASIRNSMDDRDGTPTAATLPNGAPPPTHPHAHRNGSGRLQDALSQVGAAGAGLSPLNAGSLGSGPIPPPSSEPKIAPNLASNLTPQPSPPAPNHALRETPPAAQVPSQATGDDGLDDLFEDPAPKTTSAPAMPSPQSPSTAQRVPFGSLMAARATDKAATTMPSSTPTMSNAQPASTAATDPAPSASTTFSGLGPPPPADRAAHSAAAEQSPTKPVVIAAMTPKTASALATGPEAGGTARTDAGTKSSEVPKPTAQAANETVPKPVREPSFAALKSLASGGKPASAEPDGKDAHESKPAPSVLLPEMRNLPEGNSVSNMHSLASALAGPSAESETAPETVATEQAARAPSVVEAEATEPQAEAKPMTTGETGVQSASEGGSPASTRGLEDIVVEMLKPQLQKWLEANMPRIVERALRAESQGSSDKGAS